jgi:hypothetical protein
MCAFTTLNSAHPRLCTRQKRARNWHTPQVMNASECKVFSD